MQESSIPNLRPWSVIKNLSSLYKVKKNTLNREACYKVLKQYENGYCKDVCDDDLLNEMEELDLIKYQYKEENILLSCIFCSIMGYNGFKQI